MPVIILHNVVVQVRERTTPDVDECVEILREVHRADGYPAGWPEDPRRFVAPPYEIRGWVIEDAGRILGHVALHDAVQDPAFETAQGASGLPADSLVAVGRLFTRPDARDLGAGYRLLMTAATEARGGKQRPFLNVAHAFTKAVNLYERAGWKNVGSLTISLADRKTLDIFAFLSPQSDAAS